MTNRLHFARLASSNKFTHYLFRFPAKFHPAVVRRLIEEYSAKGDTILDPFCGSGSLLVEAVVRGRHAIGIDIDPIATFISRAKSRPIPIDELERSLVVLLSLIEPLRRSSRKYDAFVRRDLSGSAIRRYRETYEIPTIPNIHHWFRNYVVIDLARLRKAILDAPIPARDRNYFLACFLSIIRSASNADPVPVSGLEVTAHMKRLETKGRRIDPFQLFISKVERSLTPMEELHSAANGARVLVRTADAAALKTAVGANRIDVAITSPPYNLAVDYYRRHTLEAYWLDPTLTPVKRVELAAKYIGRVWVREGSRRAKWKPKQAYLKNLLTHLEGQSAKTARAFRYYAASMASVLDQLAAILRSNGQVVIVVGNSKWGGRKVRPTRVIEELSARDFQIVERFYYPVKNRYMSYTRHNGADVNHEHVIVLRKKEAN